MNKKRHYTTIKQFDFDQIKLLQGANLSVKQIIKVTGRSSDVINRLLKTNSLEEYKQRTTEVVKDREARRLAIKNGNIDQASPSEENNLEKLLTIAENISARIGMIDSRLKYLEEHVPTIPKRKFFG